MNKEYPILFKTPMIQAIQDGRKNQTRRIIKPQPPSGYEWLGWSISSTPAKDVRWSAMWYCEHEGKTHYCKTRYGDKGDVLWVRETWAYIDNSGNDANSYYEYYADTENPLPGEWLIEEKENTSLRWKPSIFMPRKACRIFLSNEGKRIERLQDITEEDAQKEGALKAYCTKQEYFLQHEHGNYIDGFHALWNSINMKPKPITKNSEIVRYESYPWEDIHETREYRGKPWIVCGNPWVVVIDFKKKGEVKTDETR